MSVSLLTPDLRRILADQARRIGILERRITSKAATIDDSKTVLFSFAGALSPSTSPPVRIWRGGNLAVLAVNLGTAGSTDTLLTVERNGSVVATVTIPDGVTSFNGEVSARFAADTDILTLTVDTAGVGAFDMAAEARFT